MRVKQGLVVFITGGGSGLGLATVTLLLSQGASLCVADRDEAALEKLQKDYDAAASAEAASSEGSSSSRLLCTPCDVSEEESVRRAIEVAVERFGTIHVAIACAGVTGLTPTLTSRGPVDMKVFESVLAVNLTGTMHVVKHAAVQLAKNRAEGDGGGEKGLIILVSSIQAKEGQRA